MNASHLQPKRVFFCNMSDILFTAHGILDVANNEMMRIIDLILVDYYGLNDIFSLTISITC